MRMAIVAVAAAVAFLCASCGGSADSQSYVDQGEVRYQKGIGITAAELNGSDVVVLKRAGIIENVKLADGRLMGVVVGPAFDALPFTQKQGAMMMVAKVAREDRGGLDFDLYDYRTDKKIGKFTTYDGLKLR